MVLLKGLQEIVIEDEVLLITNAIGVENSMICKYAISWRLRISGNNFFEVVLDALAQVELIGKVESLILDDIFDHLHKWLGFSGSNSHDINYNI